jgi:hypothetical protein
MSWKNDGVVAALCLFLGAISTDAGVSLGQTPELMASATMEAGTLELYASVSKPFGLDGREQLFRVGEISLSDAPAGSLQLGPWKGTSVQGAQREELVLGFLFRNQQGEIPAAHLRTVTAYRATFADNSESAYWPLVSRSPFEEISNFEWGYELAPLVIEVPKGTRTLAKLEGAIVHFPQAFTEISLSREDVKKKAIVLNQGVVVISRGVKADSHGLTYEFLVCRTPQKLNKEVEPSRSGSGRARDRKATAPGNGATIFIVGVASTGEKVSPNGQMMTQVDDATRRQFVSKLKAELEKKPLEGDVQGAVASVLTNPRSILSVVSIEFLREKAEFDSVEFTIRESTGDPVFQTFVLHDVPLARTADAHAINNFVAQLPREKLLVESPVKPRKWQDTTGKFTVLAKLVNVSNGIVSLQKEDGTVIQVPLEKLSEADRQYLEAGIKK